MAVVLAIILTLTLLLQLCHCYDVLMVIGGMYIEQRVAYTLTSVEVIGPLNVCQSYALPEPRHSLFGGRLSDRAIVCGGNDGTYERAECFVLMNNANGRWARLAPDLGEPLVFAAAAGDGRSNFYVIGGRRYDHERREWEYQTIARVYNKNDNIWRTLTPLPKPMGKLTIIQKSIYIVSSLLLLALLALSL